MMHINEQEIDSMAEQRFEQLKNLISVKRDTLLVIVLNPEDKKCESMLHLNSLDVACTIVFLTKLDDYCDDIKSTLKSKLKLNDAKLEEILRFAKNFKDPSDCVIRASK